MLKNKYKKHQNYSYSLLNYFLNSNKPICILVKNNKEALYLQNELGLLIDKEKIKLFPENEILPYDHFSIPKNINKKRFKIINNNSQDKHILITSIKNLFDRYPTIDNFKSKKSYEVGSQISLNELIKILESLNYIKKDNVENINEYTVRGGIIDIYTPIYKNPLRVEIFDDKIESIRFFNIDNQLSIKETKNFSLTKGDFISFDKSTINLFIDSWREYFIDFDERYCSLFQNIKNQIPVEGIEIYLPFFFKNTSSFFEIFSNYEFIKFEDLNSEILDYKTFINERFNDESNEINRPLIKPEDLYIDMNEIINNIKNIKSIRLESFDCPYNKIEDLISDYEEILSKKDNYIIMTSNAGASEMAKAPIGFNRNERSGDDSEAIKRLFAPEFRNRLDAIIKFKNLNKDIIEKIVDKFIDQLEVQLQEKKVSIEFNNEAKLLLANLGFDKIFGARPLERVIQKHIKKPLANKLLFEELINDDIKVSVKNNDVVLKISPINKKIISKNKSNLKV